MSEAKTTPFPAFIRGKQAKTKGTQYYLIIRKYSTGLLELNIKHMENQG